MSEAKLGLSYDDKFSGMELGKLWATVAEQAVEIERLEVRHKADQAEIEALEETIHALNEAGADVIMEIMRLKGII